MLEGYGMIPRWLKTSYYTVLSPFMRLNSLRYQHFPISNNQNLQCAHLGPGQKNYITNWINIDANLVSSRPDIWADLRFKLPFPDEFLDCIYSHHVIEHLPNLDNHFHEMFRVLTPGAVLRIGGPHGDNAMQAMQEGLYEWFGDWPTKRHSMGGRFENFIFCKGEHLTILTKSFLIELAEQAGFEDIQICNPGETSYPEIITKDILALEPNNNYDLPHTLIIEAKKPLNG